MPVRCDIENPQWRSRLPLMRDFLWTINIAGLRLQSDNGTMGCSELFIE